MQHPKRVRENNFRMRRDPGVGRLLGEVSGLRRQAREGSAVPGKGPFSRTTWWDWPAVLLARYAPTLRVTSPYFDI